jgi:hypothetical protein
MFVELEWMARSRILSAFGASYAGYQGLIRLTGTPSENPLDRQKETVLLLFAPAEFPKPIPLPLAQSQPSRFSVLPILQ